MEMAPLANNAGPPNSDPNAILNECRDIDSGINTVEQNLEQLRMIQQRTLDDADSSASSQANRQLDALSSETMALYRTLTERVRQVKSSPEARSPRNSAQVGRVDRRLKAAIQQYQQVESQFQKRTRDQMARQYRIVRPEASEQEVRAAVEDTSSGGQVFQQALMQSDRQGRARAALSAVQDRHKALVKIEQQMVELSQLFQDMDTLVVQQEAAVTQIEQKGEEVVDHLDKGNEEMGTAVKTARATRKKKWWCLGICCKLLRAKLYEMRILTNDTGVIILIIVIVVLIYVFVIKDQNNGNKKRHILLTPEMMNRVNVPISKPALTLKARNANGDRPQLTEAARSIMQQVARVGVAI
ncbi:t-SNARE [Sarocladium strictum]